MRRCLVILKTCICAVQIHEHRRDCVFSRARQRKGLFREHGREFVCAAVSSVSSNIERFSRPLNRDPSRDPQSLDTTSPEL
jgi:hypothetical protein